MVGGGPDAGKSTVARILVRRYGLGLYSLDKRGQAHLKRLATGAGADSGADSATYLRVLDTSPAGRLAELEPAGHVDWTRRFARDRLPLLLEDLRDFRRPRPILAEGAGLLPELVKPLLTTKYRAIWLVPSDSFIRSNWERSKKRFVAWQAVDPAQAKRDLMAIDRCTGIQHHYRWSLRRNRRW